MQTRRVPRRQLISRGWLPASSGHKAPIHQGADASQGHHTRYEQSRLRTQINQAIENGDLRLADVDAWLQNVEGWGNQHVYLYGISSTLRRDLTEPKIRQAVTAAGLDEL